MWLLGLGERGGTKPPGAPGGKKKEAEPVQDIPDIGAWPRTVPDGGEKKIQQTGGTDPIAWRRNHYDACKRFLSEDDRSVAALTSLVETGRVEKSEFAIDAIALSVVAHWDIETASGLHEYNWNVGGAFALPGQQYFLSTDVQSKPPKKVAFCAYDGEEEGIADYFGVLSYERYASALAALLMLPTDPGWFSELGWAGYYGMDPVAAEKVWSERRAMVSVDVGLGPEHSDVEAPQTCYDASGNEIPCK
jgi:hypothetical protein